MQAIDKKWMMYILKRDVNPWRHPDASTTRRTAELRSDQTPGSFNKLLSSRKTVVFISPRLCRAHLIYRYNNIVSLLYPTWQRNITQLDSKPERAPSCLWHRARLNLASSPLSYGSPVPTDVCLLYQLYINIISTLIQHILRHHHNRNMDLTYI